MTISKYQTVIFNLQLKLYLNFNDYVFQISHFIKIQHIDKLDSNYIVRWHHLFIHFNLIIIFLQYIKKINWLVD